MALLDLEHQEQQLRTRAAALEEELASTPALAKRLAKKIWHTTKKAPNFIKTTSKRLFSKVRTKLRGEGVK